MGDLGDVNLDTKECRERAGNHLALFGEDDTARLLFRAAVEIDYLRNPQNQKLRERLRSAEADLAELLGSGDRLQELSRAARRNVSGDFDWSASKLSEVVRDTRELCDAVDAILRRLAQRKASK